MYPETYVQFHTDSATLQRLYDEAVCTCRKNLKILGDDAVLVEGGAYQRIWVETQPMGGEMYAKHNMAVALNNQLLFMCHQREDGRLPGTIGTNAEGLADPRFSTLQGFCFPWPALNMYYWLGEDREFLDRLADMLERYDAYLWRTRDSDGDGILESFCQTDTGEDHAARFGDAPFLYPHDTPPEGYVIVPMASMDLMSYSYTARDILCEISKIRGDGNEEKWRCAADEVAAVIREKLWDESRGACFDRDKNGNTVDVLCHNNLRCMYFGSFSQEMADRFVNEHLLNPEEFWTALPLPSVAANDLMFRNINGNNWSGQCQGLTYQRAILALERYGYEKIVTSLGKKLFDAVANCGYKFPQQFNPFTGEIGFDADKPFEDGYGPTALSVLEYIAHIWGVTMVRGKIWFSLGTGEPYTYEQGWNGHRYRIESDGKTAAVLVDGCEKFRTACGKRVITDREGNVLWEREIE